MKKLLSVISAIALAYLISLSVYSQNQNIFDYPRRVETKNFNIGTVPEVISVRNDLSDGRSPAIDSVSVDEIYALGQVPDPNGLPDTLCAYYQKKYHGLPKVALKFTYKNYLTNVTYFDTTVIINDTSIHSGTYCIKSPPYPVVLSALNSSAKVGNLLMGPTIIHSSNIVHIISGDTTRPSGFGDDTTDNEAHYCVDYTKGKYNHGNSCQIDNGGVGFGGETGNFVAGFRNKASNSFFINSIEYSFYDSIGGGNHPYKIVIYGDDGTGKPGTLLYLSSLLTGPPGINFPNSVIHNITTPVSIPANSKFFIGYRQTSNTNISASFQNEVPVRPKSFYYSTPDTSNTWSDFRDSLADFRLDISAIGGNGVINLNVIPQGFYNLVSLNMKDTVKVYLRNSSTPYGLVDSGKGVIDSLTFSRSITIPNAPSGSYYIVAKHRNSIETWSKLPVSYTNGGSTSYDFTSAITKAYGNNMILVGSKYCIFSGDVNQDGSIDIADLAIVDNDSYNFLSGYFPSDLNGDGITDLSDALVCDNNAFNFVGLIRP
jgi:hypothetical protein